MSHKPLRLEDLQHLSPEAVAKLLTAEGGRPISKEIILADVADGAPVNADGTLDLISYTAWLLKEMKQ